MDDTQLLPADPTTSCDCVDNNPANSPHVDPRCAYINFPVKKLERNVRFHMCACGNDCGGPLYLKEICANCSKAYLQNWSKIARLLGSRLVTRLTVDNYLDAKNETIALRAIEDYTVD